MVWEGPLGLDDQFAMQVLAQANLTEEEKALYNQHTILIAAARHFRNVRFLGNSGFLRTRDILLISDPKETPDDSLANEWERTAFRDGSFQVVVK
jgi:hypothetical protein